MATSTSKLVLNGARDIPFNKLVPSAANVRKVKAGGRRLQALQRLVKAKRLAKTQGVPCVVQTGHSTAAEEDSLAENVQRAPLHPLDQFRAFRTLREQRGMSDEAIAAAFFVS